MKIILVLFFAAAGVRSQSDPSTQAPNTWQFQYHKAVLGDVTHPYENGFSWDFKNNIGVVFGGHLGTYYGQNDNILPDIMNTNMTYLFSFSDFKFSKIFPMDRPPKRCGVKLVYDEGLGLTLAFGGAYHGFFNGYLEPDMRLSGLTHENRRSTTVPFQFAPWGFDGNTRQWYAMRPLITHAPTNSAPYYGFGVNFTFASEYGLALMAPTQFNRVYTYSAYSNQWTLLPLNAANTAYPAVEDYLCATYDTRLRKMVWTYANSGSSNGTWSFDVGTHSWNKLAVNANPTPGFPAWNGPYSCATYDRKNGVHIYLKSDGTETWALNLGAAAWTRLSPVGAPPSGGSLGEGFTYDPVRNVSIVYSAQNDEVWTFKYGPGVASRPAPPMDPFGVTRAGGFDLSWTAAASGPAAAQYYVYRAEWEENKLLTSGLIPGPYARIDSVRNTAWADNDTALLKKTGAFHSYFLTSVTAAGVESDPSGPVYTRLRVPLGLSATVVSKSKVILRWKPGAESDLAGYNIYRAEKAYPRNNAMKAGKLNAALVTGISLFEDNTVTLNPDTLAMYVVTAVNKLGKESGFSPFATTAPDWPVNLWADTAHQILTWSPPRCGGIVNYRIYESPIDTFDETMEGYTDLLTPVALVTDTFWSYAGRNPVGAYKIRAINALGQEGHFSDVFEVQTKDQDTIGMFRLDYMTERPSRDGFYDDLPMINVESFRRPVEQAGLFEVIPNPIRSRAVILTGKGVGAFVGIYDCRGRRVARLTSPGLTWDASKAAAGIYLIRAELSGRMRVKRVAVVR